jgi:hypothetical protein
VVRENCKDEGKILMGKDIARSFQRDSMGEGGYEAQKHWLPPPELT